MHHFKGKRCRGGAFGARGVEGVADADTREATHKVLDDFAIEIVMLGRVKRRPDFVESVFELRFQKVLFQKATVFVRFVNPRCARVWVDIQIWKTYSLSRSRAPSFIIISSRAHNSR